MKLPKVFVEDLRCIITAPLARQNVWVESSKIKVYVRVGRRCICGELVMCLDVASVEVAPRLHGRGLFTALMCFILNTTDTDYIYLENALNPILADWCIRHSWEPDMLPTCFYHQNKRRLVRCPATR